MPTIPWDEAVTNAKRIYGGDIESHVDDTVDYDDVYQILSVLLPNMAAVEKFNLMEYLIRQLTSRILAIRNIAPEKPCQSIASSVIHGGDIHGRRYFNDFQRSLMKTAFQSQISNRIGNRTMVRQILGSDKNLVKALSKDDQLNTELISKVYEAVRSYIKTEKRRDTKKKN